MCVCVSRRTWGGANPLNEQSLNSLTIRDSRWDLHRRVLPAMVLHASAELCVAPATVIMTAEGTGQMIVLTAIIGMVFAVYLMCQVAKVKLDVTGEGQPLLEEGEKDAAWDQNDRVRT